MIYLIAHPCAVPYALYSKQACGGYQNVITTTSTVESITIGGGWQNGASGNWTTIAGGHSNTVTGEHATAGRPVAGPLSGGGYTLSSGFWAVEVEPLRPAVYLPLMMSR